MKAKYGKRPYTVFFDDDVDFRKRIKKVAIKMSAESGEMVTQGDALMEALRILEDKYKPA